MRSFIILALALAVAGFASALPVPAGDVSAADCAHADVKNIGNDANAKLLNSRHDISAADGLDAKAENVADDASVKALNVNHRDVGAADSPNANIHDIANDVNVDALNINHRDTTAADNADGKVKNVANDADVNLAQRQVPVDPSSVADPNNSTVTDVTSYSASNVRRQYGDEPYLGNPVHDENVGLRRQYGDEPYGNPVDQTEAAL